LDEKIKTEKENVEANRKAIKQYDEVVDQTMGRSTDEKGAATAQAIRRSQQKDRTRILQEIQQSQAAIAKYSEERAPLSTELKKVEADIGPIKYIAALAYGTEASTDIIEDRQSTRLHSSHVSEPHMPFSAVKQKRYVYRSTRRKKSG